jgi:hypothetical protein
MKKVLLSALIFGAGISAYAQNQHVQPVGTKKLYPYTKKEKEMAYRTLGFSGLLNSAARNASPVAPLAGNAIGETYYDLQSNSATPRKIVNWGDGTRTVIWTVSAQSSAYSDRGTAYQYWDGDSWRSYQTARIESVRTGFGAIGSSLLNNTKEAIMAHYTTDYTLRLSTNSAKGDSVNWNIAAVTNTQMLTSCTAPSPQGAIWPRIAIGGPNNNTIHQISTYSDTCSIINGIKRPFVYSRSTDGGTTWVDQGIILPGYDNTRTLGGSAEDYAIDATGDNVAVLFGGLGEDVALWKSNDNGGSWNKMYVDSFPFAPNYEVNMPLDSMHPTNDGSLSVTVDGSGKAHVVYAYSEVGRNSANVSSTNPNGAVFSPGSLGLVYWNETTQTKMDIPILLADVDRDGDGQYMAGEWTTNYDDTQGPAARYGNNSVLHKPMISVDASGNIFVVFSLVADNDTTFDGQGFRDIWVVASADGGANWTPVQNITCSIETEESFPSLAKNIDNNLHIMYQEDFEPGTTLTNNDPASINQIKYISVDKAAILAGNASCFVGVNETQNTLFNVSDIYPNPFNSTATLAVSLTKTSDVEISIYNTIGQKVAGEFASNVPAGKREFTINGSNLKSGLYFYTVTIEGQKITKKMIIE